ncbi:DUF6114 domain-containing protein [Rhodococcus sp. 1R11]|uniref:DUF6114 domain-containing protein n=1 Tax=Rhodococcus sp. 1R11 TaxID=2559614 RepID=UPI001FD6CC82|nr:DUF6114 domain-containing protein [Rhodococcus sp. 1R11]
MLAGVRAHAHAAAAAAVAVAVAVATVKVGDLLVSISTIAGVSTLLLGSLMLVCACSVLTHAAARLPAGVAAMVLALVALPAANMAAMCWALCSG